MLETITVCSKFSKFCTHASCFRQMARIEQKIEHDLIESHINPNFYEFYELLNVGL